MPPNIVTATVPTVSFALMPMPYAKIKHPIINGNCNTHKDHKESNCVADEMVLTILTFQTLIIINHTTIQTKLIAIRLFDKLFILNNVCFNLLI